jgi:hypothetical protein
MGEQKAADVCRQFFLGDAARKLLTPQLTAEQYLQLLVQNKQYVDAVRLLAYTLPKPQAIRWATICARQFSQANPSEKSVAALEAIDKWLADPSDENRRAAMKEAEKAEFGTPAGSTALAVFFSGGSVAPRDAPFTGPDEAMTPNSVFNAVMLSVFVKEPEKAEDKYKAFLSEGQKIATESKAE